MENNRQQYFIAMEVIVMAIFNLEIFLSYNHK
jgi:hypothetical protein